MRHAGSRAAFYEAYNYAIRNRGKGISEAKPELIKAFCPESKSNPEYADNSSEIKKCIKI